MSLGSRSGVNWIRLKLASMLRASVDAMVVLPVPGGPWMRMCPPARRATPASASGSVESLPVYGRVPAESTAVAPADWLALSTAGCEGAATVAGATQSTEVSTPLMVSVQAGGT